MAENLKLSHEEILKLKPSVENLSSRERTPIYALLENIRSLYNVGAVFRTSDAILLKKLFLCGYTGSPPRKEISKTALGAEETVPWEKAEDSLSVIKKLKQEGIKIVALELTKKSVDYSKMKYEFPCCLVIGNEIEGISEELVAEADHCIDIPMLGRANSLNVATAYGIAIYEMLKQYTNIDNPYR